MDLDDLKTTKTYDCIKLIKNYNVQLIMILIKITKTKQNILDDPLWYILYDHLRHLSIFLHDVCCYEKNMMLRIMIELFHP